MADPTKTMKALNILKNLGGGVAQGVLWDQVMHENQSVGDSLRAMFTPQGFKEDKLRGLMGIVNMFMGTRATQLLSKKLRTPADTKEGINWAMAAPAKDALMSATALSREANKKLPAIVESMNKMEPKGLSDKEKMIAGILGLGALGVGAYGAHRLSKSIDEQSNAANAGRVMVTLPTKNPNDIETQVSIPLVDTGVSAKTYQQLGRDVRRRLRGESKERKLAYINAIKQGVPPEEADMLKLSNDKNQPQGFLAGSHIKAIAKEHAPEEPMPEQEASADSKGPDLKPLTSKLSEQNKKISEQEKRIKQMEKYLGQVNGDKLGRVRENLRGLNKSAQQKRMYSPTAFEVNDTPQALNTKGGVMGVTTALPTIVPPSLAQYTKFLKPYLANSENPLISRIFGYTKPSPNAIVPMR